MSEQQLESLNAPTTRTMFSWAGRLKSTSVLSHRYRADFAMLIERGLLIETMLSEKSETTREAPVFKVTATI